jgi:hypothetical protein
MAMTSRKNRRPQRPTGEILTDLISGVVTFEGRRISMRELMIRAMQNSSLNGDIDAALDLHKLREASGVDDQQIVGCLVVPEQIPLDQWERLAAEQQAKYREKNYGNDAL